MSDHPYADVFILNLPDDERNKPRSKRSSSVAWNNPLKHTHPHP